MASNVQRSDILLNVVHYIESLHTHTHTHTHTHRGRERKKEEKEGGGRGAGGKKKKTLNDNDIKMTHAKGETKLILLHLNNNMKTYF